MAAACGPTSGQAPVAACRPACRGQRRAYQATRLRSAKCQANARPAGGSAAAEELGRKLRSSGPLPSLAVMDLDHTLFRCYLDMDSVGPPYSRECEDSVRDRIGNIISLYPESRLVCDALRHAGVKVCVASRSPVESWYLQVMDLLELRQVMEPVYIHGGSDIGYPGTKLGHFKNITKATGIEFPDMIFMDDEYGNIEDMTAQGVCCHFLRRGGPTTGALEELVEKWQAQNC